MAKKVTMQQIANYVGVSKYVVSRTLGGKDGVSGPTKQKVLQAASVLGYFTQNQAPGMDATVLTSTKTANKLSVLILMPTTRSRSKEHSFWGPMLDGVSQRLEEFGYGFVIITDPYVGQLTDSFNRDAFFGVIGIGSIPSSILLDVYREDYCLVLIDHEDRTYPCDTVFNNNFEGTLRLTNHLLGLGHSAIEFVGNINYAPSFYDRYLGYRSAMEAHDLKATSTTELAGGEDEHQSFDRQLSIPMLVERRNDGTLPTAFVCANDSIAERVLRDLKQVNITVPGDVSVTGFDNIEKSYESDPTLTTVQSYTDELGKRAVDMLIRRYQSPESPFEKVVLQGNLMLRESTTFVK
ncbi:substrate-binding domain-containing protein [Aureibacillus halotolerans]|uniref:LacI family transcriptional regulator n=1 Tax=Aureibacillus halotolerans TaxID=1508390 RepID=A0A4R6U2M9_9BACI|nr:substrate-binding domain-containing protein [Aureibacillus halotolerans]TDQ40688.1 LacI family transcriptional regulator [Aureibacillus halotolerans]